jgi:AcrR family transcriptional regulator
MIAGLTCFAEYGYSRARLTDIVAEAGVTTGALYGHFNSKADFFDALFSQFGEALSAALDESSSLADGIARYLEVSREYRGVVRASAEVLQARAEHAAARRRLREACAGALAWHLREPLTQQRQARIVARVLVDVLDQYAHMEATDSLKRRSPSDVAEALSGMVTRGVYVA